MKLFLLIGGVLMAAYSQLGIPSQTRGRPRVEVTVELTQVPVIAFDNRGAVATHLSKDNFKLFEDGIEQHILFLDKERQSTSFVILADVSQSMTNKIPFVREAALSLLDSSMSTGPDSLSGTTPAEDEFALISFDTRARVLVPFTSDDGYLERQVPLALAPSNGSTSLFDAIYLGLSEAMDHAKNSHRAVIIISDGGDNSSRYNLREIKAFIQEADVPVFAVMAGPLFEVSQLLPLPAKAKRVRGIPIPQPATDFVGPNEQRGPKTLKTLTEASGGGVFTAHDLSELPRIVQTIGLAVRYQSVLSYRSQGTTQATQEKVWHKLRLELNPIEKFKQYNVYYKSGYYRYH